MTAMKLVRDSYVNDNSSKVKDSKEKLPDGKLKYDGTVSKIMELVSMKPKVIYG